VTWNCLSAVWVAFMYFVPLWYLPSCCLLLDVYDWHAWEQASARLYNKPLLSNMTNRSCHPQPILPTTTSATLEPGVISRKHYMPIWTPKPATTTMARFAPATQFQTYHPKNHRLNLHMKKRTATMTHGGLHGSTTMSITTKDITRAVGCLSSCCYQVGVVCCWLLLLSPTVDCCIWFFLLPCWIFLLSLSCRAIAGTTHSNANVVATALTITTATTLRCIVLQCANVLPACRLHLILLLLPSSPSSPSPH